MNSSEQDQAGKLRVGLLLGGFEVTRWQHAIITRILEGDYAEITLVALDSPPEAVPNGVGDKIRRHGFGIGSAVAGKVVQWLQGVLVDRLRHDSGPTELVDARAILGDVEHRVISPRRTRFSDYVEGDDLDWIRDRQPDVLIRMGFRILRGDVLNAARHGVWSLHHGDNRVNRGGPAGYWESVGSWPATGVTLQILNETLDGGAVIGRSWSATHDLAATFNQERVFWRSVPLIPRALERLQRVGSEEFFGAIRTANSDPHIYSARLYRFPRVGERVRAICSKIVEKIRRRVRSFRRFDQWILMYHSGEAHFPPLYRFKKLQPPRDRFWADPMIHTRDATHYVFVEEFVFHEGKGKISVLPFDEDGPAGEPEVVLEKPYHLSYPFVFEANDRVYMIPESAENRTVELYEATEFPSEWTFRMNLLEGVEAYDATLVHRDGRWWMFATIEDPPGSSTWDELFLFSSDELLSNAWTPHPLNPIVSDVRCARPAGRLFERGGSLYRPSQNSSYRYGYGFNLHRITTLTPDDYSEELVTAVEPDWDPEIIATHSFASVPGLTVIDAQVRRRR